MFPHERSLVERFKDEPFVIVGVNSDQDPARLAELQERERITWPSFFDGGGIGGPIAIRWGVRAWPTIYVIDAKGVIRATDLRGEDLERTIERLIAEAKAD
jgi:hypothetical protein